MQQLKLDLALPLKRREGLRFLTGRGRHVADLIPEEAHHATA